MNSRIEPILDILTDGGIILFPTDTTWAIGCDATNEAAVGKLLSIKRQNKGEGLVVLADSLQMVKNYVDAVHPKIDNLLQFHVRPLTIVYERAKLLPDCVKHEDGSIAFRISSDPIVKMLIGLLGKPIIGSLPHFHGRMVPNNFGEISSDILQAVDGVVKMRQDETNIQEPSVMIRLGEDEEFIFLRE